MGNYSETLVIRSPEVDPIIKQGEDYLAGSTFVVKNECMARPEDHKITQNNLEVWRHRQGVLLREGYYAYIDDVWQGVHKLVLDGIIVHHQEFILN